MSNPEMTEAEIINAFKKAGFFVNDKGVITVGPNDTLTACELTNVFNIAMSQRVRTGEAVPFAYVIPGDGNANDYGWIDCRVTREGEFTQPVYLAPPSPPSSRELVERVEWLIDSMSAEIGVGSVVKFKQALRALLPQEPKEKS
jgi:hypothetical protein